MKIWQKAVIGILAVASIIIASPSAMALGGEPSSLTWSVEFTPGAGYTGLGFEDFAVNPNTGDSVVAVRPAKSGGGNDGLLIYLNDAGTEIWRSTFLCSVGQTCGFELVRFDLAGRVMVQSIDENGDRFLRIQRPSDGTLLHFLALDDSSIISTGTPVTISDFDSVRNNDTSLDYLIAGSNRFIRLNQTLESEVYNRGLTNPTRLFQDPSSGFSYVWDSTNKIQRKVNTTTGVEADTNSEGATVVTTPRQALLPSQVNDSLVYHVRSGGSAGNADVRYDSLNITPWTDVTNNQVFTPGQIDDGSLRSTFVGGWDVDGADRFLTCGSYSTTETRGFVAQFLPSNNTMHWNFTLDLGSSTTAGGGCEFDTSGGFYVAIIHTTSGESRVSVRHYDGGWTPITPRQTVTIQEAQPVTTATPTIDAGGGVVNFAAAIGFQSAGSQFLFGLVLVVIAMVVVAASIKSFAEGQPVMLAAGVAGIGMAIFNSTIGLWAAWTTVVLVIIASGIVAFIIRRGVFGFGGQGG